MRAPAEQLLLSLGVRPDSDFASYFVSAENDALMHALRSWLTHVHGGVFFIAGPVGAGRSHLLQAAAVETPGALYLPLTELASLDAAALLDGLESTPLLCLDDIDGVCLDRVWCEALFHLYNRHVTRGGRWLVSARQAAAQLTCVLPDLKSRLASGGSFSVVPLDDDGRRRMLQLQARQRGIKLSDAVAGYILRRHARDTPALLNLLDRIDRESLRAQRPVTLAFVRHLLESPPAER